MCRRRCLNQSSVTQHKCPINVKIPYLTCNWRNTINPENPWKWGSKMKLFISGLNELWAGLRLTFLQVHHCGGIKTAQTKTTKNMLNTWGNRQQYTGIKKKTVYVFSIWSHIVSHVRRKACRLQDPCTALRVHSFVTRAVGSFCNGTFVVFSPTAELN